MATLTIETACTETQMKSFIKKANEIISEFNGFDVYDMDEEIDGFRVCIEFEYLGSSLGLSMKGCEVLNPDYDLLAADTAVFEQRMLKELEEYNRLSFEALKQGADIEADQNEYWMNPTF